MDEVPDERPGGDPLTRLDECIDEDLDEDLGEGPGP